MKEILGFFPIFSFFILVRGPVSSLATTDFSKLEETRLCYTFVQLIEREDRSEDMVQRRLTVDEVIKNLDAFIVDGF